MNISPLPRPWEYGWLGCLRGLAIGLAWLAGVTGLLLCYAKWYMAQQ